MWTCGSDLIGSDEIEFIIVLAIRWLPGLDHQEPVLVAPGPIEDPSCLILIQIEHELIHDEPQLGPVFGLEQHHGITRFPELKREQVVHLADDHDRETPTPFFLGIVGDVTPVEEDMAETSALGDIFDDIIEDEQIVGILVTGLQLVENHIHGLIVDLTVLLRWGYGKLAFDSGFGKGIHGSGHQHGTIEEFAVVAWFLAEHHAEPQVGLAGAGFADNVHTEGLFGQRSGRDVRQVFDTVHMARGSRDSAERI